MTGTRQRTPLTLRTPRGRLVEGFIDPTDPDLWAPTSGLGLVYQLHVLYANGWTTTEETP